jgi:SsrA-binding protein
LNCFLQKRNKNYYRIQPLHTSLRFMSDIQKKVHIYNRKASFEYSFLDKYTAGIVLKGTEIKSARQGKINLQEAFCFFIDGELFLRGAHISPYEKTTFGNHEAKTDRKLLLKKKELKKLEIKLKDVGLTIVPTVFFVNDRGLAKVEIALAKGKKLYDKREDIKQKDIKREMDKAGY